MGDETTTDSRPATEAASQSHSWRNRGLALLTGLLVTLSLPTTEIWPLAFVAWIPLLLAVRGRSRWQRFRLGWLTGFVIHTAMFRWIPFTMVEMTGMPEVLGLAMCLLYGLWHGLMVGLFAMLLEPIRTTCEEKAPALSVVMVGVLFAGIEWIYPVIFPWTIGAAVQEVEFIAHPLLSLQGAPLLSAVIMLPSALIADWFSRRRALAAHTARRPTSSWGALATIVASFGIGISGAALLEGDVSRELRVAVLQPNFTLAEKKKANLQMRRKMLDRIDTQIRAIPAGTFDIIVATEGSFPMWWRLDADSLPATGQPYQVEATRRIQRAVAEGPKTHLLIGGLRQTPDGTRNATVHLGPDGKIQGHYDKQTLVPFSEYMPFSDTFESLRNIKGIGHMEPGETPCRFDVGFPVACGICYENLFAEKTRSDLGDARMLANLTIDTWFGDSTAPRLHLLSHAARAAELGVPLLRGGLTGESAIIDHRGQFLASLPLDVEGLLDARVAILDGTTIYREIGQIFAPLGLAVSVFFIMLAWRARKRHG
jgi:apolipoprotein N-acyltransferase